jgi:hypothetical protein
MDETDLEAEPFLRDEVQELRCELLDAAAEATFVLTFRGAKTRPISALASAEEVRAALVALETIRDVRIDSGPAACAPVPGNRIRFFFLSEHGDVPPLRVVAEEGWIDTELRFSAGTVTYLKKAPFGFSVPIEAAEVIKGTTREAECSGRGLCNRETGRCQCFEGFGADKWGRESCAGRLSWLGNGKHLRGP